MSDPSPSDDPTEVDVKDFRKQHPSGFMELFAAPSMVFILDALIETAPQRTFTKTELANRAGVSTETLRKLFPTLQELYLLEQVDETNEYRAPRHSPIYKQLLELNGLINAIRSGPGRDALDNLDSLPEHRFNYYCPDCGRRGQYCSAGPTGHILECPDECTDWVLTADDPPGAVIRWNAAATDDTVLRRLQRTVESQGWDALTEYQQALVKCTYDENTPDPVFGEGSETDS